MMEFMDFQYSQLTQKDLKDLYHLRKLTFKDRLNWQVHCQGGMEFDEYDGADAVYLIGRRREHILGCIRFIDIKKPNMLRCGVFNDFFEKLTLPSEGRYVEASRLFIDKNAVIKADVMKEPVSRLLLIAAINFCRTHGYDGIYTVLTHAAYILYQRYGWEIKVVEIGFSEKEERVYYVLLSVDEKHTFRMFKYIERVSPCSSINYNTWPLKFICQSSQNL